MTDLILHDARQIREFCARKLASVDISRTLAAVLRYLFANRATRKSRGDLFLIREGALLIRSKFEIGFLVIPDGESDLFSEFLHIADFAGLNGDERDYLLELLDELKQPQPDPLLEQTGRSR